MSLVRDTRDLYHLVYVMEKLRVPHPKHESYHEIIKIKQTAVGRLLQIFWLVQAKTQAEMISMGMEIQAALIRPEVKKFEKVAAKIEKKLCDLARADTKTLQSRLNDPNPLYRLGALQVIHRRRLPMEKDLLERLLDPEPLVREAAHQALVRLARGADLGPKVVTVPLECKQAVRRWKKWYALQDHPISSPPGPVDPAEAEAIRLAVELVGASKDQEPVLLAKLQEAPEPQGTLALATAVGDLKGPRQIKARKTLAKRLAGDPPSLKKRLADPHPEIRRAALAALAGKKDRSLIPETLKLLEDPQVEVAQSARTTLKFLTGKDFGPAAGASPLDRTIAIGRWYRWWLKQKKAEH